MAEKKTLPHFAPSFLWLMCLSHSHYRLTLPFPLDCIFLKVSFKSLYSICYSITFVLHFVFLVRENCGMLAPRPGMEPAPLALDSEVLTTGSPEKSLNCTLCFCICLFTSGRVSISWFLQRLDFNTHYSWLLDDISC